MRSHGTEFVEPSKMYGAVLRAGEPLPFREYMTNEPLPLASIFREIFVFLTTRSDAVLFGAHAVNAYCVPERMTQDVDLLSTSPTTLAEDLRAHLAGTFHIAIRVREVIPGLGLRIYQVRKPKNRHLVDVRQVLELPAHRIVDGVRVIEPADLVAMKVSAMTQRQHQPKGSTDFTDLRRLLLAFPHLKAEQGPVAERLRALGAAPATFAKWRHVVCEHIEPDDDEGEDDE